MRDALADAWSLEQRVTRELVKIPLRDDLRTCARTASQSIVNGLIALDAVVATLEE